MSAVQSKELLRKAHTGDLGPDGGEVPLHWKTNSHRIFIHGLLTYLSFQFWSVVVPYSFCRLEEKRDTRSGWPSPLGIEISLALPVSVSQTLMKVALGGSLSKSKVPLCLITFECHIIRGKAQGQIPVRRVDQHIPFGCTFLCYLSASGSRFQDCVSQVLTWCSTPLMWNHKLLQFVHFLRTHSPCFLEQELL